MRSATHLDKSVFAVLTGMLFMAALTVGCSDKNPGDAADAQLTPAQVQAIQGKNKARICTGCHGPNGVSRIPSNPSLAGLPQEYIIEQLHAFKDGRRKNPMMSSIALNLTETDIADLGAYFSSLPKPASNN